MNPYILRKLSKWQVYFFVLAFCNNISAQCPTNPPGDQIAAPIGSWIGYVYADTDGGNPPANCFTTTYRGYITESEKFDHSWTTGNPISGSNVCGSYNDNFAIRYKMRQNFIPGKYIFRVGGDNGYRLSLDGGNTFPISNWNSHADETTEETFTLAGYVDMVLEYYENSGGARVSFTYDPCSTSSSAPTLITSANEICTGSNLTLTASGGFHAPGATYQWGTGNTVGSNTIVGAVSASLTITPTANTTYWVRRVDSGACGIMHTTGITKTITLSAASQAPASITGNTNLCYDQSTTLTANNFIGSIQWQISTNNTTFNDIAGETGPSLITDNLISDRYYRTKTTNGSCSAVLSTAVKVTVSPPSQGGTITGSTTVCSGLNSTELKVASHLGTIQWQRSTSTNENTFTDIVNENSDKITVSNLNTTTYYRTKVTNGTCDPAYSPLVSIIVSATPVVGSVTGPSTVCAGVNNTTLSLTMYSGSVQWESSLNGTTFSPIINATSKDYIVTNLSQTTYFRAAVYNGNCPAIYSNSFLVTLLPQPLPGTISNGVTVCSGTNSSILTLSGSYTGSLQWQVSSDGNNFSDISGETSASFTATNLTATKYYRVKFTNGSCNAVYSNSTSVIVNTPSVGGTIDGATNLCSATNTTALELKGSTGNIQWESSPSGINNTFTSINGATSTIYEAINLNSTTYFRARVTNGNCNADYSPTVVISYTDLKAGTISGATTLCAGINSATLTLNNSLGAIQWQISTDNNTTYSDIAGAINSTYTATNLNVSTFYRAKVSSGSCTVYSDPALITIANTASAGTVSIANVAGSTLTVPVGYNNNVISVSGYNGSTLQWQKSTDNVNFTNITGATGTSHTVTNISATTYYRIAITGGGCTVYSNSVSFVTCIKAPIDDYGTSGIWRVHFYAQHDGANPPSNPFTTYQGSTTTGLVFDTYFYNNNLGPNVCPEFWTGFNGAYRYKQTRNFTSGTYSFLVGSNGGYRLSVDGGNTWLVNEWATATGVYKTTNSAPVTLSGNVNLVIEYYNTSAYNPKHSFSYCGATTNVTAPTSISGTDSMCAGANINLYVSGGLGTSYQWGTGTNPGTNVISTTGGHQSFSVTPTTTTTYWCRRYDPACQTYTTAVFKTVTVTASTPQTPAGNTTDYGNNKWIGYVYVSNGAATSNPLNAFSGNYSYTGYVTTASDMFSFSGNNTTSPPAALTNIPTLCSNVNTAFSIRYKMTKNFTPGYYTFTITADDGMRFSVDGGATWAISRWNYVINGITNTYSVFLSGQKNLIIEYNQNTANMELSFGYTACTDYATAPTTINGIKTICSGSATTLTATGGYHPSAATYEWGTGNIAGTNLLPNTTASITVTPSANTTYWVRRKNGANCNETVGTTTSYANTTAAFATVTLIPLSVAGNIAGGNTTVCAPTNSTKLDVSGNIGNIQWQSSTDDATWSDIIGQTGTSYTATNLIATRYFRVQSTSGTCSTAVTPSVNIIVNPKALVGSISGGGTVCANSNSTNLILDSHTGSIQWQSSTDNATWSDIAGATATTYTAENLSVQTHFRVVVTSGNCIAAISGPATINITPLSQVGTISGSTEICAGPNSNTLTLNSFVGTIQWQSSTDNATWSDIFGANAATYTANNLVATTYYRAVVTNGNCDSATSESASIVVKPLPVSGNITGATDVCFGNNATELKVTGVIGAVQWQSSSDDITFSNISGATEATYNAINLATTTYFRVKVTNGSCTEFYSGSIVITVQPVSIAGSISGAATVCTGINQTELTLNGSIGLIQWKSSLDNLTFTDIPGANGVTYTAVNLTQTTYFKAFVTRGVCSTVSTASAKVFVNPASVAGNASGATNVCMGVNTSSIQLRNYLGAIQWQQSDDGGTSFTDIPGATSEDYAVYNLSQTRHYRAKVATKECSSEYSNTVMIEVLPIAKAGEINIQGTTLPTTNVCAGTTNSTLLTLLDSAGTLQWQSSPNDNTYTNINGAQGLSYLASGLTQSLYFRVMVSSSGCGSIEYSEPVLINVSPIATYNGSWSMTPNATTAIVVRDNLTLGSELNVCSCQITDNATLTISSGVTLLVQKDVAVGPTAQLIIEDGASLVQIDDSAVNTGNITVKRNSTPMKPYDYTYWSSPVQNMTLNQLSPNTLFDKYFSFNPMINNWVTILNGSQPMAPGIGYIVRAPQGWSLTNASNGVYNAVFNGVPNNGIINTPIQKGSGILNLIGNPYPSAIDIDLFLSDLDNDPIVEGTIYLWTHNTIISNLSYTADDYAKYNLTGGVRTASAAVTGGLAPTGKIASGQSFFIEANSTSTAKFKNSMRVQNNNSQFYKTTQVAATGKSRLWLNITNSQGAFNEMLLGYVPGATNEKDRKFDGPILSSGNYVSLYSILGDHKLAIQGRSLPFDNKDIIPLGFQSTLAGTFSISMNEFDGLFSDSETAVYLVDKLDNSYHNLKEASYDFTTITGTFENRFELRFTNTTLGTNEFNTENSVMLIEKNHHVEINSGKEPLESVAIYDLTGKCIYQKARIGNTLFVSEDIHVAQQVLVVKMKLQNGIIVSKKLIMP